MGDVFDLSQFTYDEFVSFFFDRDMATEQHWYRDQELFDLTWSDVADPQVIVEHMTRMFTEFEELTRRFSPEQVNAAIWAMFSCDPFHLQKFLWMSSLPLDKCLACIRSMYAVYSDHVAKSKVLVMENCFDMWWDLIAGGFWDDSRLQQGNTSVLNQDQMALLESMFETLSKILALPDQRTQGYALHGLGHLHHPGVKKLVQRFLDQHRHEFEPAGIKWVEQCRDGTVM